MKTYDDPKSDIVIDTDDDVRIISARNVRVVRCGDLDASGATIDGDLDASRAEIGGDFNASGATIGGWLDTVAVKIEGDLDASWATIGENLDASSSKIVGSLDASGATISGWLDLSAATVDGDLNASCATIGGVRIAAPTPAEREMITRILAEADAGNLRMDKWHSCGTTHCIAGFSQVMSGRQQRDETALADGRELLPSVSHLFFTTEAIATKELRRILAAE